MNAIQLNTWLLNTIRSGDAILFLGAGATVGARGARGREALNADQLRDAISDKFLSGRKKSKSLAIVADYAANISSLTIVQTFVKEQFADLEPAEFHYIIAQFRWRAIFTTNYDLVLEKVYQNSGERLQTLAPIISDKDNVNEILKDQRYLPYFKLHGCIDHICEPDLPLILASEQYARYEKKRKQLFKFLKEWGLRYPIIFCGYEIEDPNIQHILFDLNDSGINRPFYAVVRPSIDDLDERVWKGRRFDTVKATFCNFLNFLNSNIPEHVRILATARDLQDLSISKWFTSHQQPSDELLRYMDSEIEHVHASIAAEGADPQAFYRGLTHSWDAFRKELDLRRKITDDIILNWILEIDDSKPVRCFLLKGYAGSGKSITLRRAAWEAATQFDELILYLCEGGCIRKELISELYSLTGRRLTFLVDDALAHLSDILILIDYASRQNIKITIVFGARTNEWNVSGADLSTKVDSEYELRDLSEKEVMILLDKLEQNRCLGHLDKLTPAQRIEALKIGAERQLLVALHEATSGKSFEELVFDEYNNIFPPEARILYLDICTLHRLGISVRAGLIHRISGISFINFKERFFKPLEHVVRTYQGTRFRDYAYRSRHSYIAQFVFEQALRSPGERVDQIIRMMKHMNIEYESDNIAFSQLIKGKTLAELFSDRSLVDQLYDVAEETGANLSHIYHQRAVFELNHSGGSLNKALSFILIAERNSPTRSRAIGHTKAMIYRNLALEAKTPLESAKLRQDARMILHDQLHSSNESYPYMGLGQLALDEIKEKLAAAEESSTTVDFEKLSDRVLIGLISTVEEIISIGLQKIPDNEYLMTLQADLSSLLADVPKAIQALESAFKATPRSDFIAVRLAHYYVRTGCNEKALEILNRCREHNPSSKIVHFNIARIYINANEIGNKEPISYHLKHSFTEGDSNNSAQMFYARHEFLYGNREEGLRIFERLRLQKFAPAFLNYHWGVVHDSDGNPVEYKGYVSDLYGSYCFVNTSSLRAKIFIHQHRFTDPIEWDNLSLHSQLVFHLAFTVRGPHGISAKII